MTNEVKLGIGLASGMFFHAAAGTALPTYPTEPVGGNGDGTTTDKFRATAGQSTFSLSENPNEIVSMTINGTAVNKNDYSVSGSTLSYTGTTLAADDAVEVTYYVSAWRLVGDISKDGIALTTDKTVEDIFTWANIAKRKVLSDHTENVKAPIIDTTEETLKTVLGSDNVTVTPATGSHGKTIACNLSSGELPDPEAFLFIMKDGDDTMAIGMSKGQITAVDSITFAPGNAIIWNPTISVLDNSAQFISEEG